MRALLAGSFAAGLFAAAMLLLWADPNPDPVAGPEALSGLQLLTLVVGSASAFIGFRYRSLRKQAREETRHQAHMAKLDQQLEQIQRRLVADEQDQ